MQQLSLPSPSFTILQSCWVGWPSLLMPSSLQKWIWLSTCFKSVLSSLYTKADRFSQPPLISVSSGSINKFRFTQWQVWRLYHHNVNTKFCQVSVIKSPQSAMLVLSFCPSSMSESNMSSSGGTSDLLVTPPITTISLQTMNGNKPTTFKGPPSNLRISKRFHVHSSALLKSPMMNKFNRGKVC